MLDPAYRFGMLRSPLPVELHTQVHGCMCDVYAGDFATNGLGEDFLARMGAEGSVFALASFEGRVVSCAMLTWDGSVGLLGGVCTRREHQRRGLSRAVVTRVVEEASGGPRWLVLGTGSKSAASIYASRGFRGLSGAFEGGARGYNPDDLGEWMMVRDSAEPSAVDIGSPEGSTNIPFDVDAYVVEPGAVAIETLGRRHMGAAVLLLNIVAGTNKLRAFGINEGLEAEQRLAKALSDGDAVTVAVHRDTRRIYGIAVRDASSGLELYTIGPPSVGAALATGAPCVSAAAAVGPSLESECREFWERGYRVFPGLLADVAASARASMDEMMKAGGAKPTSDWNAVNSGGAEFVLQVDEQGCVRPGRVLKVQAAALASPALLEVLGSVAVRKQVERLYSVLGQEVPDHVDVFGTKFFPMWPGGTSVSWHQDCHYFGTASPQIISCGVYLEDTDRENGCLRVVPGSHTRGVFPHSPGSGQWAQGEWVETDESVAVDVAMPAGSVVLFNAMLLHAAHRNSHASRTRYSMFGHFVPASLNFSWRETDFSHGVYPDRHSIY